MGESVVAANEVLASLLVGASTLIIVLLGLIYRAIIKRLDKINGNIEVLYGSRADHEKRIQYGEDRRQWDDNQKQRDQNRRLAGGKGTSGTKGTNK